MLPVRRSQYRNKNLFLHGRCQSQYMQRIWRILIQKNASIGTIFLESCNIGRLLDGARRSALTHSSNWIRHWMRLLLMVAIKKAACLYFPHVFCVFDFLVNDNYVNIEISMIFSFCNGSFKRWVF
ncbi:Hypothetical predicted protein [Olea europaea subsp. europaea]|uniref:Uncharacterized protein n=1 Tax=Olea europaea subsp. europaea TaxID=158383 RepID=A0A8S0SKM4_OLEEU|nr:Hypothetical predicted protein [Olea europaea subsp. europaea]